MPIRMVRFTTALLEVFFIGILVSCTQQWQFLVAYMHGVFDHGLCCSHIALVDKIREHEIIRFFFLATTITLFQGIFRGAVGVESGHGGTQGSFANLFPRLDLLVLYT